jgi:photosystem II stability/assembly factor-like uncharacterized protein
MTDGWELVTHWSGGVVTALATTGDSGDQQVLAATAAGLHVSSDGGRSWRWIGLGPAPIVVALAPSPSFATEGTVLAGAADGLYRSSDGGRSWRQSVSGSGVPAIVLAPDFAETGVAFAGTAADGLLRSDDAGLTWAGTSAGLLDLSISGLAVSPTFGRDRTAFVATPGGLYRSRNSGRAWRLLDLGTSSAIEVVALSPKFSEDGLVLAGSQRDGLFRSDDGGQRWERVEAVTAPSITTIAISVRADGGLTIAVGTGEGIALSPDGGASWQMLAPELGPILSLAFVNDGEALLAGTLGQGLVRCEIAPTPQPHPPCEGEGEPIAWAWEPSNEGLAGRATVGLALAPDSAQSSVVAVASLDGGVSVSSDGGATWALSDDGLALGAVTSVAVVVGAAGGSVVLAATPSGLSRTRDLGATWERVEPPAGAEQPISALSVAATMSGSPSVVIAAGAHVVVLSLDGGETWRALPRPADAGEIVGAACSPDMARDRTVYVAARAPQPIVQRVDGAPLLELWRSTDLGMHWSRWLQAANTATMPLAVPRPIAGQPAVLAGIAGRVAHPLAGAQEVRGRERRPIWQEARIGAPLASVTAVALSPSFARDQTVFAAADTSVYVSRDGGDSFETWDHGLTVPIVTGLGVAEATDGGLVVYALGLGGTLWRRRS